LSKRFIFLLVLIWIGIIYWLSNQAMQETTHQTYDVLIRLGLATKSELIQSTDPSIVLLKFIARKGAHLLLFTILGSLFTAAVFNKTKWRGLALILPSWLLASVMGVADEVHQYFVPGRTMLVSDMLLDSAGAFIGVLLTWGLIALFFRPHKVSSPTYSKSTRR
jgi:VanZ family protein